ncbi:PQQ-binding-like beta-propeller repeat protein [Natronococcus sp. A-GB1]|uniref:outer membrane protein assembly factor BamB family protein n=1 Tax=Natronococcus sp. A-GB1 TaxID=3037648 RepID=UPI00241DFF9F|nr:PQQ-binding-like beta-propeller repeat protein [Natronococcus sp. A-GB1]MDG5761207.1 PQQ-binding-like beta-propeller repeat protein [Natronococcus sp. A-GB1]
MANWRRRSVLSTGVALAAGSVLASAGTAETESEGTTDSEGDGWSSYRGNAGNTAHVPTDDAFPEPETVAWTYDRAGDLAAVDGTVYLRTGTDVHALEDGDGSVLWAVEGLGAAGTPAVTDDTVYVGGEALTALDVTSGEVRWTTDLEGGESTSPTVADGTVYLVADGELLAFDAGDGDVEWRRESVDLEREGESGTPEVDDATVSFAAVPLAVASGSVYAAVGDGIGADGTAGFAAFDAETGETRWTYWEQWRWDPHGYVIATADRVYTGSIADGDTYPVLDAETGAELERLSFRFPPAMTDETRVTADRHGFESADHGTGENWSEGGGTDAWRLPVIVGETLIIPYYPGDDHVNALYGFDFEDGTEQWTFTHDDLDIGDLSDWYAASEDTVYVAASGDAGGERLVAVRSGSDGEDEESETEEDEETQESDDEENEDDGNDSSDDGRNEGGDEDEGSDDSSSTDSENEGSASDDENDTDDDSESDDADGDDGSDEDESDGSDGDDGATDSGGDDPEETLDDDESAGTDDGYTGEETDGDADGNATGNSSDTDDDGTTGDGETDTGTTEETTTDGDDTTADDSDSGTRETEENSSASSRDGDEVDEPDDGDPVDEDDDIEEMPGFTTGAGIAGGALGLEWLRRRASVDEDDLE